ncbi:MAG: hypothetical protein JXR96_00495 [Deltaproteobacteria bacterium]|nr:hypothetical protein [Deltaproteobacteria bacterium]
MSDFGQIRFLRVWVVLVAAGLVWGACEDPRFRVRTPPGQRLDVFRQVSVPQVDVLWVVDNSDSMVEEQRALAANFGEFYRYLESTGADYHIGVTSTDVYSPGHMGRLLGEIPIITPDTPDSKEVFADNVNVGVGGTGNEQGLAAALMALTEPMITGTNAGFLRDDAFLFIIFVSDEDDCSTGEVTYYLRRFEQLKGIGNDGMVTTAAVVGDVPEVPDWCRERNVRPGTRYAELSERSGGLVLSICDEDFGVSLDQLGFSAAGMRRTFALSSLAAPDSISVWFKTSCASEEMDEGLCEIRYDDCVNEDSEVYGHTCVLRQSLPDGWAYEQETNSIRFFGAAVPPFGAIVEVGYIPEENL